MQIFFGEWIGNKKRGYPFNTFWGTLVCEKFNRKSCFSRLLKY